eukprot:scaffold11.g3882.t1
MHAAFLRAIEECGGPVAARPAGIRQHMAAAFPHVTKQAGAVLQECGRSKRESPEQGQSGGEDGGAADADAGRDGRHSVRPRPSQQAAAADGEPPEGAGALPPARRAAGGSAQHGLQPAASGVDQTAAIFAQLQQHLDTQLEQQLLGQAGHEQLHGHQQQQEALHALAPSSGPEGEAQRLAPAGAAAALLPEERGGWGGAAAPNPSLPAQLQHCLRRAREQLSAICKHSDAIRQLHIELEFDLTQVELLANEAIQAAAQAARKPAEQAPLPAPPAAPRSSQPASVQQAMLQEAQQAVQQEALQAALLELLANPTALSLLGEAPSSFAALVRAHAAAQERRQLDSGGAQSGAQQQQNGHAGPALLEAPGPLPLGLRLRPLPVPALLREGVSAAQAADWAERARPRVNRALLVGHRLASGRDPPATGIAVALLYATARAATLSLTGLAYGALLALFTLPKWYEMHQDKVDAAADRVRIQATRVYDRHVHPLVKRIPKYRPPSGPAESSAARKEE